MTHFIVLVFGDDVEGQLEPYDESDGHTFLAEIEGIELQDAYNHWRKGVLDGDPESAVEQIDKYPDAITWVKEYEGLVQQDGDWGYFHNPDAKWDWYIVGGRWSGFLILKDGCRANEALVKDVDWEAMRKEHGAFVASQFVFDGQWVGRWDVGWWGLHSDPHDDVAFNEKLWSTVGGNPNEWVTVVDCHI